MLISISKLIYYHHDSCSTFVFKLVSSSVNYFVQSTYSNYFIFQNRKKQPLYWYFDSICKSGWNGFLTNTPNGFLFYQKKNIVGKSEEVEVTSMETEIVSIFWWRFKNEYMHESSSLTSFSSILKLPVTICFLSLVIWRFQFSIALILLEQSVTYDLIQRKSCANIVS